MGEAARAAGSRQAPIGRYIVDFASFSTRIVIEIDGGQHAMHGGMQSDRERDTFLRSQGFYVLRFWNSDSIETLAL